VGKSAIVGQLVSVYALFSINCRRIASHRYIKEGLVQSKSVIRDFWANAVVEGKDWRNSNGWSVGTKVLPLPGYCGRGLWLMGEI
jgi:hypothetical protein